AGVRTLPEALRLATGVHVARLDSRTWAISARGLNATTANKMLVLIDGRTVYTPLFSGVFWDVQNVLLEDVDRIEVIRGPGATLWGSNAVNGVVNVVTRSAGETQGGLAVAAAGDEQEAFAALRWGGELGRGHYRAYGMYDRRDGMAFADGRDANDDLWIGQAGFRSDLALAEGQEVTLLGDVYRGTIGHAVRDDTDVDGGNLTGSWTRRLAGGGSLTLRGFYDHTFRRVPGQFEEDRHTWDVELQHDFEQGRHHLVWGGGVRWSSDRVVNTPVIGWVPASDDVWIANLFLQDEIELSPRWRLTAGVRIEDQSVMDLEAQPSLRLAWEPWARDMLWAGVARAVRAPTRIDRAVRVPGEPPFAVVGNPDFEPEEVWAYEVGYRWTLGPRTLVDVAAFYNVYDELRSQEPSPTGLPLVLGNRLQGHTRGVEVSAALDPTARLRLHGGVTWLHTDLQLEPGSGDPTGGRSEANDPDFHGFLRADLELAHEVVIGAWLRQVAALPSPAVPSYTELDLRLAWRPLDRLTLALVGRNLLHDRHPELGSPPVREEVERSVSGELTWAF
ncbi:MAG TPA: TonB-dependent receptor, partial [Thermoanaerobaculia bacterium]|nr:TonB-dependent receptor [Thermoanaerobaculia bacterium]